jgi:hypothetical protein
MARLESWGMEFVVGEGARVRPHCTRDRLE